jgi:hypothetical protein
MLEPQELTEEQVEALMTIPVLPNPFYNWLKLATKHATNDSQTAAVTKAALSMVGQSNTGTSEKQFTRRQGLSK